MIADRHVSFLQISRERPAPNESSLIRLSDCFSKLFSFSKGLADRDSNLRFVRWSRRYRSQRQPVIGWNPRLLAQSP